MKKVNNRPIIHLNHNKDESKVSFIDAIRRVEVTEFSVFLDGAESFIWFDDDFRNILKSLSDEKRKSVLEKISSLTMNHLRNCIKMKVDIDNGDIESIIRNVKTRVYKEEPYYFIMNNDIHTKLKEMVDRQIYLCTKDGETDLKFVVKTDGHGVAIYLTKKMGKKVKNLSDESRKEFEKMTVEKLKAIIKGSFLRGENISAEELMNHISHNLDLFKENQRIPLLLFDEIDDVIKLNKIQSFSVNNVLFGEHEIAVGIKTAEDENNKCFLYTVTERQDKFLHSIDKTTLNKISKELNDRAYSFIKRRVIYGEDLHTDHLSIKLKEILGDIINEHKTVSVKKRVTCPKCYERLDLTKDDNLEEF